MTRQVEILRMGLSNPSRVFERKFNIRIYFKIRQYNLLSEYVFRNIVFVRKKTISLIVSTTK